jgi:excisionase family DNA binding protein
MARQSDERAELIVRRRLSFLSFIRYPANVTTAVRPDAQSVDPVAFAAAARKAISAGTHLRLQAGDAAVEVDDDLAAAVLALLEAVGAGLPVDVNALPAELTTGQAADLLGVSRPTVVSLVDRGALAASRVGTHRRIRTVDVLAFRERARQERTAALDELVAVSEELGLYDS